MSRSTISTFQLFQMIPDAEAARLYLESRLWPEGATCPSCLSRERITTRKGGFYRCNRCALDFTVRTATIFERSHVPLHKWVYAMYLVVTARKGISSMQMAKEIGVTQKTAWFMLQRLREACEGKGGKDNRLSGLIEVDECFVGGLERNKHEHKKLKAGRGSVGKTAVLGLRERGGETRAMVIDATDLRTLHGAVHENVKPGSLVCTDEAQGYNGLDGLWFNHRSVNHGEGVYAKDSALGGSVLIWVLGLVCVLLLTIFFGNKVFGFRVVTAMQSGLTGNFKVIPIPNCAQQEYAVRGLPLINLCPASIVRNSCVQSELDILSLSRLQSSWADSYVCAFLPFNVISVWSGGEKTDVAFNNMRGSSPDIYDLEGDNTSNSFGNTDTPFSDFFAEVLDASVANYDSWSILQNQGRSFEFRNPLHLFKLAFHEVSLSLDFDCLAAQETQCTNTNKHTGDSNASENEANHESGYVPTIFGWGRNDPYISLNMLLMFGLEAWAVWVLWSNRRDWRGWLIALGCLLCLVRLGVSLYREDSEKERETRQLLLHDSKIVQQKLLTHPMFLLYSNYMANVLNTDKQIAVIGALAEGSSIRSIERITGVHRDTIMRLGVKVGNGCTAMMDSTMRDLPCTRLEMDEVWGFVGKKDKQVRIDDPLEVGSVWTFCAIDADTKLVPAFKVGHRNLSTTRAFISDVASRMRNRVQISTDAMNSYPEAIEESFGDDVDYGQIVKSYGVEETHPQRRYSAPEFVSAEKRVVTGRPNFDLISTSYVERLNATTRLHMRRLTRLTLAFSKKRENFEAAVGLHFAYYNFVRRHNTLRCTPAMAAGVTPTFWSVGDLLEATA